MDVTGKNAVGVAKRTQLPWLPGTTRIVHHQHDVNAVCLYQFHKERPITHGIQAHGLHVVGGQLAVLGTGGIQQGLEETIVLLREKTAHKQYTFTE